MSGTDSENNDGVLDDFRTATNNHPITHPAQMEIPARVGEPDPVSSRGLLNVVSENGSLVVKAASGVLSSGYFVVFLILVSIITLIFAAFYIDPKTGGASRETYGTILAVVAMIQAGILFLSGFYIAGKESGRKEVA